MAVAAGHIRSSARLARLLGATALGVPARRRAVLAAGARRRTCSSTPRDVRRASQMLLEADTLVYDNDNNTVTAAGGVQIDYGGNKLVAQRSPTTARPARLVASGDVALVDSDGTKVYSDEIDITDDFADGFVNALRVETVDKTYFAAESAEREGGVLTTFNNGVYTACEPCEEKPNKRADLAHQGAEDHLERPGQDGALRELALRVLRPPDRLRRRPSRSPTRRSSARRGFLFPGVTFKSELGAGINIPFYFALSPTYDLTLNGRYYTKQGFLGMAEWRQRFNNGQYSLRIAGIYQQDPEAFDPAHCRSRTAGRPQQAARHDGHRRARSRSTRAGPSAGTSCCSPTRIFPIPTGSPASTTTCTSRELYLTGLDGRNYFDLRAMKFQVQEQYLDDQLLARNDEQPWLLPSFDYSYTPDQPVFGGELNFDMNAQVIHRSALDYFPGRAQRARSLEGNDGRLTAEAEWKKSLITDAGLVITPMFDVRGDAIGSDLTPASLAAINNMAGALNGLAYSPEGDVYNGVVSDLANFYQRFMATAGLELRWPLLFSLPDCSHVLEPVAQVFARPNAAYQGKLGIPNEDAQSFVFDATTLFERDKFSGFDRIEGGTRANLGMRYSGSFASGWTTNALFGQSYQLGGENPFAEPDLVNAGAFSGLETDVSDYVALAGFATPHGLSASVSGRFDEQTFEARRTELRGAYSNPIWSLSGRYAFIQAQPLYGFPDDRREMTVGASTQVRKNWRVFGSGTYDLEADTLVQDSARLQLQRRVLHLFDDLLAKPRPRHPGYDPVDRLQRVVPHARRFRHQLLLVRHHPIGESHRFAA